MDNRLAAAETKRLSAELVGPLLSSPSELSLDALSERGWVAVVLPEPLSEEQAGWLADAAVALQEPIAFGVLADERSDPEGYRVPMEPDEIRSFHADCLLREFLLVPESGRFAVLDQGNYFLVVAGPAAFVRRAVGGTISEARRRGREYFRSGSFSEPAREWLIATVDRYADLSE